MASSSTATLTSLWLEDGQNSPIKSPVKSTQSTPSKSNGKDLQEDFAKYYKGNGLEGIAKETGILDANGELAGLKEQNVGSSQHSTPTKAAVTLVTLPAGTSLTTAKGSPLKLITSSSKAALIQAVNAQGSPVILSSGSKQQIPLLISTNSQQPQIISASVVNTSNRNWVAGRKRSLEFTDTDFSDSAKKRKMEKNGKGLRHFSMKVCEKVQKKGITSYNEVADELVAEFSDPTRMMSPTDQQYDQKNIRRRVYDALNVLMAMNIISKEKKEIRWIGLPTNSAQECTNLEQEKRQREERIKQKKAQLQELILQQIAFKNLVQRNRHQEEAGGGTPSSNSAIHLPFIIVNTSKKTIIDCSISNDKCEYLFNFDNTFEIHDDIEVLKRMGMACGLESGKCSQEHLLQARKMVPKALEPYVLEMANEERELSLCAPGPCRSKPTATITAADAVATGAALAPAFRSASAAALDKEVAMATAAFSQGSSRSGADSLDYEEEEEEEEEEDSDNDSFVNLED